MKGKYWYAATLLIALSFPFLVKQDIYIIDVAIMVLIWASLGGAWNIIGGYAGQLSLGHSAFIGLGAYTSTILFVHYGISPWIGMTIGCLISGLIGVLLSALCFRLKGPFFCLVTIAFAEVLRIIAINMRTLTEGTEGIVLPYQPQMQNMMFESKTAYFYIALSLLISILVICRYIEKNKMGLQLEVARQNDEAARAIGIKVTFTRIKAMALSAILTSICGTFYAQYILFIEPDSVFSLHFSTQPALMSMVGGIGTAFGPILGAILIVPLEYTLRGLLGDAYGPLYTVIYGCTVALVVIFLPNGIFSPFKNLFKGKRE